MKKLITISFAVFMVLSVFSQKTSLNNGLDEKLTYAKGLFKRNFGPEPLRYEFQNRKHLQNPQMKSAGIVKPRLDSAINVASDKEEFMYDENGHMIRDSYFEWNGTSWDIEEKMEYTWDVNGKVILSNNYSWDYNHWINDYKNEYSYNPDGNLLTIAAYFWENDQWLKQYKYEYTFDSAGNKTQFIFYFGTGLPHDTLIEVSRIQYSYDSSRNLVRATSFQMIGNQLNKTSKMEPVYGESGKVVALTDSILDNETDEWVYDWREEYDYDIVGNKVQSNSYQNGLNASSREQWIYDDFGNMTEHTFFFSDWETGALIPISKEVYAYDNNYSFDDLIVPFYIVIPEDNEQTPDMEMMFNHKLINITYYENDDENGTGLKEIANYQLYYSEQNISGIRENVSENSVILYPNPAQNQIVFQLGAANKPFNVVLFDIGGKVVFNQFVENNKPTSIGFLNDGLYFYRLTENGKTYSGKLLLKKSVGGTTF